jgi:hypothetical protein
MNFRATTVVAFRSDYAAISAAIVAMEVTNAIVRHTHLALL